MTVYAFTINPGDYPWWTFLILAPVCSFVGWFTNVVALKMTFYPIEFFGIPLILFKDQPFGLFGWQGYVAIGTDNTLLFLLTPHVQNYSEQSG